MLKEISFFFFACLLLFGCTTQSTMMENQSENQSSGTMENQSGSMNEPTGGGTQAPPNSVTILNFAYDPATITVSPGTTVTWTNEDPPAHTVTGTGFDSGSIGQGETYSYTFNETGTFPYGCTFHPNMHGTVVVQ